LVARVLDREAKTIGTEGAGSAGASIEERTSNLWSILPSFDPAVDDPREYVDKVKFLRAICPAKDKGMLVPRLAMLMKGTAWAQIKGSDTALLSDPEKGVDVLLASVATWEENSELQTYDKFERALYKVIQRNDETTLSYVNRLNVAFTELGQVDIADMRAFILLRQSALLAEDKKKVITLTGGELTAKKVEGAMRSLSTKVLGGQTDQKKKTYPVNFMDDDYEEVNHAGDDDGWDEEMILQSLVEQGDEDAQTVSDFEDQLIDVCQESSELSLCFSAYADARARIRDKLRARGFWPASKGSKGRGRKGGGFKGGGKKKNQTLADRIASSACRICGVKGHWKWECPRKGGAASSSQNADVNLALEVASGDFHEELQWKLPSQDKGKGKIIRLEDMVKTWDQDCLGVFPPFESTVVQQTEHGVNEEFIFMTESKKFEALTNYLKVATLESRLSGVMKGKLSRNSTVSSTIPILSAEASCPGIIDTGASKSVIGQKKVKSLLHSLPTAVQTQVHWGSSNTVFRFGNNGTLPSVGALYIPFGARWMRLEVVKGETPFLLSNAFLKATAADVCSSSCELFFTESGIRVPLHVNSKGLYTVELADVLKAVGKCTNSECADNCEVVTHVKTVENSMKSVVKTKVGSKAEAERPLEAAVPVAQSPKSSIVICEGKVSKNALCDHGSPRVLTVDEERWSPSSTRPAFGVSRGSVPEDDRPEFCADQEASRCGHHASMGTTSLSGGEEAGHDLCPSVSRRCSLSGPDDEPQPSHLSLGAELPELCQSQGQGGVGADGQHKFRQSKTGDKGTKTLGGLRLGVDDRRGEPGQENDLKESSQLCYANYDDRKGSGERTGDHDEDCHPPKGTGDGEGYGRSLNLLECGPEEVLSESFANVVESQLKQSTQMLNTKTISIQQELDALVVQLEKDLNVLSASAWEFPKKLSKSPQQPGQKGQLDVLEIYCGENSRITAMAQQMGLKARRFTKADGDLRTAEGQRVLWELLERECPRDVWMAPECGPWGNFSRLNLCRSSTTCQKVLDAREEQRLHLKFCDEVYNYQVLKGNHFHMEQPQGSIAFDQPEMENVAKGTLKSVFDM
jgi:hypothetical protein